MKKFSILSMMTMAVLVIGISSCSEDVPEPTVRFLADVDASDPFTVNITLEATDAASFEWDYGDGVTSTESSSHAYTYQEGGEYTIMVTASGDGGTAEASNEVSIVASLEDILAGTGDMGKTWVLTQTEIDYAGKIGAGAVDADLGMVDESTVVPTGFLHMLGLGAEYDNEYTFYKDGSYKVDVVNGEAPAGIVYGDLTGTTTAVSASPDMLPLCSASYPNIENGTWSLSYDDFTVTAYNELTTQAIENITYTFGEEGPLANLVLSSGAFIGLVDLSYPATPEMGITEAVDNSFYLIKEISPEALHVVVGVNGVPFMDAEGKPLYDYEAGATPIFIYPTLTLHLTLEPK